MAADWLLTVGDDDEVEDDVDELEEFDDDEDDDDEADFGLVVEFEFSNCRGDVDDDGDDELDNEELDDDDEFALGTSRDVWLWLAAARRPVACLPDDESVGDVLLDGELFE